MAAGHPNPLVHVGLAVKVTGDGVRLNPPVCVLDTDKVCDRLALDDTPKERLTLLVRVTELLTDDELVTDKPPLGKPVFDKELVRVVDGEALRLREPVPDTLRDAGTDNEGERLAPNETEGELLGLRDPETVRVTDEVAAGHPNPRVHVGLAVRLPGDGD